MALPKVEGRSWGWEWLGKGLGMGGWCAAGVVESLWRSPKVGEEVKVRGQHLCQALEALGALGDKTQLAHFKYYVTQIFPYSINIQPLLSQLGFLFDFCVT